MDLVKKSNVGQRNICDNITQESFTKYKGDHLTFQAIVSIGALLVESVGGRVTSGTVDAQVASAAVSRRSFETRSVAELAIWTW